ncbi:MAG: hypothetical protein GDA48_14940 [Hormoscilla sp. GM102CHS1]|nr:hypothetical protein [Hormoscilla sp. GM102CHS1]
MRFLTQPEVAEPEMPDRSKQITVWGFQGYVFYFYHIQLSGGVGSEIHGPRKGMPG